MLGADLAVLGALGWVRRGVWLWAVLGADLAVLGALGWVGRGIWPCWARWAGLGVGFGRAGRAGLGWAWGFGSVGRAGAFHGLSIAKRAKKQGCCEHYLIYIIDLLALFGVYAGVIFILYALMFYIHKICLCILGES